MIAWLKISIMTGVVGAVAYAPEVQGFARVAFDYTMAAFTVRYVDAILYGAAGCFI